jgi:thiol-disulfide isomerase/thioredoxin
MKKILAIQITALILVSGALGGMFAFTDVYDETYSRIVSVICLSCIKLNRIYSLDYEFETANREPHPEFIIDDLEKGPIFISFRTDVCDYCDYMEPLIKQIFNLSFEKEDVFSKQINFSGTGITFYHINKDHAEAELKTLQAYYDIDKDEAVPMFTIITLEYHHGIISPYYLTFYGILNPNYTDSQRIEEITNNILNAIKLYKENRHGFVPDDFKK